MPLYEYHCPSCDLTFEVLTSLSEASKKKPCPECGRRAPRIVSAFAIASGLTPQAGIYCAIVTGFLIRGRRA